jgi:hypothetical protein
MLASIGGRYTWPTLPAVIAAAGLFLLSGVRVGADAATRSLDFVLVAALAVVGLQMMPLPPGILRAVSPATASLQDAYALNRLGVASVSVHAGATRAGFICACPRLSSGSAEAFSHGEPARRLACWRGSVRVRDRLAHNARPRRAPCSGNGRFPIRARPIRPFVDRNRWQPGWC